MSYLQTQTRALGASFCAASAALRAGTRVVQDAVACIMRRMLLI